MKKVALTAEKADRLESETEQSRHRTERGCGQRPSRSSSVMQDALSKFAMTPQPAAHRPPSPGREGRDKSGSPPPNPQPAIRMLQSNRPPQAVRAGARRNAPAFGRAIT